MGGYQNTKQVRWMYDMVPLIQLPLEGTWNTRQHFFLHDLITPKKETGYDPKTMIITCFGFN